MHILPLPLCGLSSICAQNGYGQHRPCTIVLLTLVAPRGVTDLYLSWGIHINHARTAYLETFGTEYQQYRRCNTNTILRTEHGTSAPNERVLRTTQLAKLNFNHPSVVLTADVFQYFCKRPARQNIYIRLYIYAARARLCNRCNNYQYTWISWPDPNRPASFWNPSDPWKTLLICLTLLTTIEQIESSMMPYSIADFEESQHTPSTVQYTTAL